MKSLKYLIGALALSLCAYIYNLPIAQAFPVLSSIKSAAVTVAATATKITLTDGYNSVMCQNTSSTAVYFGGSGVTTSNGFPVCSGSSCAVNTISLDVTGKDLYAIVASDTVAVRCIAGK
jgi:hypothetical protein